MEQGENLIIARVADASGNRDTAEVYLTYRDMASYRVQSAGPNPASTSVRFEVVSSGRARTQTAFFRVFDQQGRLLSQAQYALAVGVDTFTWDAQTFDGSSLAPGVYYWTLSQSTADHVPVDNTSSGMVTIVR
jgi:flagellar hook assembly protein FlgD